MYHSSKTQNITGSASFPVIMVTLALMILGMALLPLLKVKVAARPKFAFGISCIQLWWSQCCSGG